MQSNEITLITMDEALKLLVEQNDPQGRRVMKSRINSACNDGEIRFRVTSEYKEEKFDAFNLDQLGFLLIVKESLVDWISKRSSFELPNSKEGLLLISKVIEPSWEHYARLPYLTANECACLIVGVNPEKYRTDEYHDQIVSHYSHDLPDEIVRMIDRALDLVERSTGLDLDSAQISPSLVYFTNKFVSWALINSIELNESFVNAVNSSQTLPSNSPQEEKMFLDKAHPCYSPKLVAAINAWECAVSKHGQSQTKAIDHIEEWLEENSDSLGFPLSNNAKKHISYVANYRTNTSSVTLEEKNENAKAMEKYETEKGARKETPNRRVNNNDEDDLPF